MSYKVVFYTPEGKLVKKGETLLKMEEMINSLSFPAQVFEVTGSGLDNKERLVYSFSPRKITSIPENKGEKKNEQ